MIRSACQDAPLSPPTFSLVHIRTRLGGGLLSIPLHPFPAARTNPGQERKRLMAEARQSGRYGHRDAARSGTFCPHGLFSSLPWFLP